MEIINSVGIEIELENTYLSENMSNTINRNNFRLERDASVESNTPTFLGKAVYKLNKNNVYNNLTDSDGAKRFGLEIVTNGAVNPDSVIFQNNLENLCYRLQEEGLESPRASLHVHINVSKDVNLLNLQSMIRWATRTEAMFYRMGSLGKDHRGIYNQYNYCRPITKVGPAVVKGKSGYVKILDTIDLVRAETLSSFWEMYGDSNNYPANKYHPVRYHWINLYSILKRGSLEFRVFNMTTNPYEIRALILLCQATANTMLKTNYKELRELPFESINSVFSPNEKDSENALDYILESYNIVQPTLKYKLQDIYLKSAFPPSEENYVFSHMVEKENVTYFTNTEYSPENIPSSQVKKCKYVDIHNIQDNGDIRDVPTHLNKYIK